VTVPEITPLFAPCAWARLFTAHENSAIPIKILPDKTTFHGLVMAHSQFPLDACSHYRVAAGFLRLRL